MIVVREEISPAVFSLHRTAGCPEIGAERLK